VSFYTYLHKKTSDGAVFYIGKGARKDRATTRIGRSERWHRTVAKHGFTASVLATWDTEAEAFEHERVLIACFRDMGVDLVNMTDGGEGASGHRQSELTKARRNAKLRGRAKPQETIARMRAAAAGRVIAPETRKKISRTMLGRFAGAKNPNAKRVVCRDNGMLFDSMQQAAAWLRSLGHEKASFKSIHSAVSGAKKTAYGMTWSRA